MRENLILQSQAFATTWAATNSSVSVDQIAAPDGTLTADKLTEDATVTTSHYVSQGVAKVAAAIQYTASCWIKAGTKGFAHLRISNGALTNGAGIGINLTTGAIGSAYTFGGSPFTGASGTVTAYANGWYRLSLTATSESASTTLAMLLNLATSTVSGGEVFSGDGASFIYLWGAQLEIHVGSASTYIQTTTAATTGPGNRTRLICWSAVGGAAASSIQLRDATSTGTILANIDVPAGTGTSSQNSLAESQGIVFPGGIYMTLTGTPTGVTLIYSV